MRRTNPTILLAALVASVFALPAGSTGLGGFETSALVQQAIDSLHGGRWELAEEQGIEVASRTDAGPDLTGRGWLIAGAARQRRGEFTSAADAYREFLASCVSPGLRRYAMRQILECESALAGTEPPKAPGERISEQERRALARVDDTYHVESSEHFIVRARNAALARKLIGEAETALERIRRLLLGKQEYPHTVDIHVWVDRDDFLEHAADAPEWSGGAFCFSVKDGVTTRRIDLTQLDRTGQFDMVMLDRIVPHELSHLVLREYFGDAPCPLLLDEGLAMLTEWDVDNDHVMLAGTALGGEAGIQLDELLIRRRRDISDPPIFYAMAFSFTEFLHARLTGEQFRGFFAQVKSGCSVPEALQRALYLPQREDFMCELETAWEDYAVAQAQYLRELTRRDMLPDGARN